jgi:hypothetical protein
MAEVTYYVALPFVAAEDGVAAGEPGNVFTRLRSWCARKRYRVKREMSVPSHLAARAIRRPGISAMPK